MKHVSMVPLQVEPAYRARLEQRKTQWIERDRFNAQLETERQLVLARLAAQQRFSDAQPFGILQYGNG